MLTVAGARVRSRHLRPPHRPATQLPTTANSATPAPTTSSSPSDSSSGEATGDASATRYGNAQVRVTVKNGKIVKVEAVQLQNGDPRRPSSLRRREPTLQQDVLSKQTAGADAVTGATYTSLTHEASPQSALAKLGFRAADGSTASTDTSALQ